MITKFKIFEKSYDDIIKPYLVDKYIVISPRNVGISDKRHYLVETTEEYSQNGLRQQWLITKKLYTLYPNNKIVKKNKHQYYHILPQNLEKIVIYKSSNIKDAYAVLASIHDSNKYNL